MDAIIKRLRLYKSSSILDINLGEARWVEITASQHKELLSCKKKGDFRQAIHTTHKTIRNSLIVHMSKNNFVTKYTKIHSLTINASDVQFFRKMEWNCLTVRRIEETNAIHWIKMLR